MILDLLDLDDFRKRLEQQNVTDVFSTLDLQTSGGELSFTRAAAVFTAQCLHPVPHIVRYEEKFGRVPEMFVKDNFPNWREQTLELEGRLRAEGLEVHAGCWSLE